MFFLLVYQIYFGLHLVQFFVPGVIHYFKVILTGCKNDRVKNC